MKSRQSSHSNAHNLIRKMKHQKRITIEGEVRLDTTTVYSNEQIRVDACPWGNAEDIAPDGRVSLKGRTTVEPGGKYVFKPYRINTGSRYQMLFQTEHCMVMRTQGGAIIEKWRFSKNMTSLDIMEAREKENLRILAYYKSRKENIVW